MTASPSFARRVVHALAAAAAAACVPAFAGDPLPDPATGFLCCNMRTDGSWISDSNYAESGKHIIPAGTPMKVTGYGRYRVHVELDGATQDLGNDYSRDIDLPSFAKRYLSLDDPKKKIAGYPPKIRQAIEKALVMRGMTRDQVFMSIGYPIGSENPRLDAKVLRYWRSTFAEFRLTFDGDRLEQIDGDPQTLTFVVAE